MNLSYQTRRRLANLAITLMIALLAGAVLWVCWIVWVGRYMVYHRDGPRLDFSLSPEIPSGVVAQFDRPRQTVSVIYNEPDIQGPVVEPEPTSIQGYYIDVESLKTDISLVIEELKKLEDGTAVLLDVKDDRGQFYYTSNVGTKNHPDIDTAQMDQLIEYLLSSRLYVIARLPALRDYEFGLNNVSCGLPRKGGSGALWLDEGSYWLDPTKDGTLDHLTRQVMELRLMGFNEVVFTDFRFPDTDRVIFEGDTEQSIIDAAAKLVQKLSTEGFFLSFQSEDVAFPLPTGNSRLYLADIPAAEVSTVVEQAVTDDPALQLLFLTDVHDTRFDDYCVLRPLENSY